MITVLIILAVVTGFVCYWIELGLGKSIFVALLTFIALVWVCSAVFGFRALI